MMKIKLYIFVFVAAMGLSAAVAGAQEPLDGVADGPRRPSKERFASAGRIPSTTRSWKALNPAKG